MLQAALLLCGSMSGALPVAAAAYMVVCFVWLNATLGLGRDMAGGEEKQMVGGYVNSSTQTLWTNMCTHACHVHRC
jgi:hypothetical protein